LIYNQFFLQFLVLSRFCHFFFARMTLPSLLNCINF
jgi:hypothetical protein